MTADHGPEVLPALDVDAARRLDGRIRRMSAATAEHFGKLFDLVTEARQGDIHLALGFTSWTAYLADALKELGTVVNAVERRQLVDWLAHQGMSERAMARALGCSQPTIHRDRVAAQAQRQVIQNESPEEPEPGPRLLLTVVRQSETAPLSPRQEQGLSESLRQNREKISAIIEAEKYPPITTGLDGKQYKNQGDVVRDIKRRQEPISKPFSRVTSELTRATERLDRLRQDERFKRNTETLRQRYGDLMRARDAIDRTLAGLEGGTAGSKGPLNGGMVNAENNAEYRAECDANVAAYKAALDAEYKRLYDVRNEDYRRYREVVEAQRARGVMSLRDYNTILSCLHPDSRKSASDEKLATAFQLLKDPRVKALLAKETEQPTRRTSRTAKDKTR